VTNLAHPPGGALVAATEGADPALHVVFRVADSEYVLPADLVLQMESYTGATHVPGAPPYVAGIVQVRGRVVPVVDLRRLFGAAAAGAIALDHRIVVGRLGERVVALLVDAAREVIKIAPSQLKPPPPILNYQAQGFIKAVAQVGTRVMMLVDFAAVIGEESLHGE
jgi:purine-binding chemotaxis protein CheW